MKDKENEIRYILQEEKQKMEKRATNYLMKKKEVIEYATKPTQALYQASTPHKAFKQEKRF